MLSYAVNPLVAAVDAPPIPAAQAWKAGYGGALGPMIDLSQAVPGAPPPEVVLLRLGEVAANGEATRYGPILGDMALREAHAAETTRIYGGAIHARHVAITAGCNLAFVATVMALAQAGDNIVLPTPWYFNHKMTLDMLGIEARPLPALAPNGFVPDPAELAELIDARTRALVLISPNNPTGAVYPPEVLHRFAGLCRANGIALVLDETYRDFIDGAPHDLFKSQDWGAGLIQLYSFSKSHAIPGHRLGALVAGGDFVDQIVKVLDCLQICGARPAQQVVAWAIAAMARWRAEQRAELNARAQLCRDIFANAPGWDIKSIGAYFAFVQHPYPDLDAVQAAERLCKQGGVLGLPGSWFGPGQDRFLRIAFANVGQDALRQVSARLAALT